MADSSTNIRGKDSTANHITAEGNNIPSDPSDTGLTGMWNEEDQAQHPQNVPEDTDIRSSSRSRNITYILFGLSFLLFYFLDFYFLIYIYICFGIMHFFTGGVPETAATSEGEITTSVATTTTPTIMAPSAPSMSTLPELTSEITSSVTTEATPTLVATSNTNVPGKDISAEAGIPSDPSETGLTGMCHEDDQAQHPQNVPEDDDISSVRSSSRRKSKISIYIMFGLLLLPFYFFDFYYFIYFLLFFGVLHYFNETVPDPDTAEEITSPVATTATPLLMATTSSLMNTPPEVTSEITSSVATTSTPMLMATTSPSMSKTPEVISEITSSVATTPTVMVTSLPTMSPPSEVSSEITTSVATTATTPTLVATSSPSMSKTPEVTSEITSSMATPLLMATTSPLMSTPPEVIPEITTSVEATATPMLIATHSPSMSTPPEVTSEITSSVATTATPTLMATTSPSMSTPPEVSSEITTSVKTAPTLMATTSASMSTPPEVISEMTSSVAATPTLMATTSPSISTPPEVTPEINTLVSKTATPMVMAKTLPSMSTPPEVSSEITTSVKTTPTLMATPSASMSSPPGYISKVVSGLPAVHVHPMVYLDLNVDGRPLGRLRILMTCGPRWREQMLRLCIGRQGQAWRGSWFDWAGDVGGPGETIGCWGYMTRTGTRTNSPTVQGLEGDECKRYVAGAVTGYTGVTDFVICTRDNPTWTCMAPELGVVVDGLEMLRHTLSQYTTRDRVRNASRITITGAGVDTAT